MIFRRVFLHTILLCFIGVTIWFAISPRSSNPLMDLDEAVVKQYAWGNYQGKSLDQFIKRGDPLDASWYVWYNYYITRDKDQATKDLDKIIVAWNLYETHHLTYGYAWNNIPAGWWSSMDMLLLPMTLLAVGNDTGNKKYIELAKEMVYRAVESPERGGSLWPDSGSGCWFSEYSWPGMTRDVDEYFVMNGHLYSLTALKIIANALNDTRLQRAFDCAEKGTKFLAEKFVPDGEWPRYMLVPDTINPPHYVIFELIQLGGLYKLTGDSFYEEQRAKRSFILERQYPIYKVTTKAGHFLFFSSIGAPHPYNPDLFATNLICRDTKGVAYKSLQTGSADHWRNNFKIMEIGNNAIRSCDLYSVRDDGTEYKVYTTDQFVEIAQESPSSLTYHTEVSLDAYNDIDGNIWIDPARRFSTGEESSYLDTEGRITMQFAPQILSDRSMFAFEIEPDSDIKIGILFWQGDHVISRYYPTIHKGKNNLVAISHLGFDGAYAINAVDRITIRIYTDNLQNKATVNLGRLFFLKNQYELFQVLESDASEMLIKIE